MEDEKMKLEERERKKAEVRRRLEEQAKAAKGKKGFMTPERKKKLRQLLRNKAAEELKREQARRAEERKRIIRERAGQPKHVDAGNEASYMKVCKDYQERIKQLHDVKFDLEVEVKHKDIILQELNSQINDLRGKFVKPTLKKVSKYDQKLEKMKAMAEKAARDYRSSLKKVKSGVLDFSKEPEDESKEPQPEWVK